MTAQRRPRTFPNRPTATVITGNALDVLPTLPADSIACTVTSPPYYGQRSYDLEPSIWGGDSSHKHVFTAPHGDHGNKARYTNTATFRVIEDFHPDLDHPDYGKVCTCGAWFGILGLEPNPELYLTHLRAILKEVLRVTQPTGNLYLNLNDTWAKADFPDWGTRPKAQYGIPWRVAFAAMLDGWLLREDIIWKKNSGAMDAHTSSSRTSRIHEYVFHFAKQPAHYYDAYATFEPSTDLGSRKATPTERAGMHADSLRGLVLPTWVKTHRGHRRTSIWHIAGEQNQEGHTATFPRGLPDLCILAGSSTAGQCRHCGVPYARRVEPVPMTDLRHAAAAKVAASGQQRRSTSVSRDDYLAFKLAHPDKDFGFFPGCDCNGYDPVPQTVLDPFSGTATTGEVALLNGRNYVGIERNPSTAARSQAALEQM